MYLFQSHIRCGACYPFLIGSEALSIPDHQSQCMTTAQESRRHIKRSYISLHVHISSLHAQPNVPRHCQTDEVQNQAK
jgi:hypothetical protein